MRHTLSSNELTFAAQLGKFACSCASDGDLFSYSILDSLPETAQAGFGGVLEQGKKVVSRIKSDVT